jgi:hypothetical protein
MVKGRQANNSSRIGVAVRDGDEGSTYEVYGVAQEDESGRVVGEFLGELGEVMVDNVFFLADFFGGFIDEEDYGGGVVGARGPEAELAQEGFGFIREGV